MEYAKGSLVILLFVAVVEFDINNCQPPSSNAADQPVVELRSMLNTVLEQNRRLTLQNKRLQQVWFGMQQMCKALSMPTCDCGNDTAENQTTDPAPPTESPPSMYVMSIKSSGTNMNQTSISVRYVATPDHTTEWMGYGGNMVILRSAGQRMQDINDPVVYTSTLNISFVETLESINFRLYTDFECAKIELNVTALDSEQEEDFLEPDADNIQIQNTSVVAQNGTDVIIDGAVILPDCVSFHEDILFIGLNTSTNPPVVFELDIYSVGLNIMYDRVIDKRYNISIYIMQEYAQYGGILFYSICHNVTSHFVKRIYYGRVIQIYPPDGNFVVEKNMFGLFPLSSQTLIFPSQPNFMCEAMGNPRPEVSVLKMMKDGKTTQMDTETLVLDSYKNSQVMSAHQPKQTDGTFICQATNGNQTIIATTEVIFLEPAMFDDAKTGVMKNTSQSIVISCKARGKPRPHLELRLYGEYGPDLTKSDMYKIRRSDSNRFTSRVTLTISPADGPYIHSVYCLSRQGDLTRSYDIGRLIELYPGQWKERNWNFFDRIVKETEIYILP